MKAFHFRLEPAFRWRTTQLQLAKERVSQATAQASRIQTELTATHIEMQSGGSQLAAAGAIAFESWAVYADRCRRRARFLEGQLQQAKTTLAAETKNMVEAHRELRVLENLKRDEHARWARELSRETEAFAGEVFLATLQLKGKRERQAGA